MIVSGKLHHLRVVGLAAVIAGCASQAAYAPPSHVVLAEGEGAHVERLADGSVADTASADPAHVFAALQTAYGALGLHVNVLDPAALTIGTRNERLLRRLGDTPLPALVDCGSSITGARASSWFVYLSVTSKVSAADHGSQVATRIDAVAIDPLGNGERIPCGSTGALEARLMAAVRAR